MIIGMTGRAGSGKDTVSDILVREHGFVKVALADPLKRICRDVFQFTDEQLWGPSSERNALDPRYRRFSPEQAKKCICDQTFRDAEDFRDHLPCGVRGPEFLTRRHALQQLGTEWGRACHPDVWIDYAMRVVRVLLTQPGDVGQQKGYRADVGVVGGQLLKPRGVVISDVRFPNEAAAIRAEGGRIWRTHFGEGLRGAAGQHVSEHHVDSLWVDVEVVPQDELGELARGVAALLAMGAES